MDDEPLALEQLVAYIRKVPYLSLAAACQDAWEAMRAIEQGPVDAIFADINMPDLNGLEFLRSLVTRPIIVFTTAYSEYAIDGYKVNAVDFLLKPFSFDEFLNAADKVRRQHELQTAASGADQQQQGREVIYVKADYKMHRLDTADIIYVEAMSEYVRIYSAGAAKPLTALCSMKRMEELLPADRFLRIHKSYIVNMSLIKSLNKSSVQVTDEKFIPIGDAYRAGLLDFINNSIVGK